MSEFVTDLDVGQFDHLADLGASIWRAFGVHAQPSYVFIDSNGDIRRQIGFLSSEELDEQLELLKAT